MCRGGLALSLQILQVKSKSLRDVVERLKGLYSFDVEVLQAVGRQVGLDELGHLEEAVLDVGDRVSGDAYHSLVIPDICVHFLQSFLCELFEKCALSAFLAVVLVDVDRQQHSACGDLRGPVVQKLGLVELEFANLKTHLVY